MSNTSSIVRPTSQPPPGPQFVVFRGLRNKLLTLMILLSLVPLAGMSTFAYFIGSRQIQARIRLSLEKMAQDTADKVDLMLREKKEQVHSMASTFPLIYPVMNRRDPSGLTRLLNSYCFNHEVYDLLIILDRKGNFIAMNNADRNNVLLPEQAFREVMASTINKFPDERNMFADSITGHSSHHDWYQSKLVRRLYDNPREDISHLYSIALSEPIRDPNTREVVGVWINIINWYYFQIFLDNVESDLANIDLRTGYAFMVDKDGDTLIGHKYRLNRRSDGTSESGLYDNLYGSRLLEDLGVTALHRAVLEKQRSVVYEFPKGASEISGLAPIEETSFGWTIGVGINGSDVLRPIRVMSWWLFGATFLLAALVVLFTYVIAEGITVPINKLIRTAHTIAQGNFNQRVPVRSSDEIGILGSTFNAMARAISAREEQLQDMNKNLESMVRQRTIELENSHEALKKAYVELQTAQDQLIQTEKMASLGQLVAGIAHEIKNPLNFIYGNTGFLSDYVLKLQSLLEKYESLQSVSDTDHAEMEKLKKEIHYEFVSEDLKTLIDNFTEGARRINTIVSDLRTFSRMDTDTISGVDVNAALEVSLNLLRNQYKDRIEVHKEFGQIPTIQGYAGKLNQVFMNLLSNAFHAVQNGGDVWIRTRADHGSIEVEIEDNGVGIAKEHLSRIFEPFFTTKPVGQGTGLGLSISYGIIQQHHGRIFVNSTPQKGSVFVVQLPVGLDGADS